MIITKKMWETLAGIIDNLKKQVNDLFDYVKNRDVFKLSCKVEAYSFHLEGDCQLLKLAKPDDLSYIIYSKVDEHLIDASIIIKSMSKDYNALKVPQYYKTALYRQFTEALRLYICKFKEISGQDWCLADEMLDLAASLHY